MKTYELLDRFEMLYPTNSKLSDLRRAYIDKDLHSIFRLFDNEVSGSIIDLRKAVIEQNLYSIFKLANDDELRKLILEDNIWKLWPILDRFVNTQFVAAFKNFTVNDINYDDDCFSRGQILSKKWLVSELKKLKVNLGIVYLCAGWYGTLATMLFESEFNIDKIRSFDIDSNCAEIAEIFNKPWVKNEWRFKAVTQDIFDINFSSHTYEVTRKDKTRCSLTDSPDTIINTSCEHIQDFSKWYSKIPSNKLVILQSNNYFEIEEHVNCSSSLEEFDKSAPMTTTLYTGFLELEKYTRYMKIGYR